MLQVKNPSVLLVQRILPHYRLKLFQKLNESDHFAVTFAYGRERSRSTPVSITKPSKLNTILLHNFYAGNGGRLVYQKPLLSSINSSHFDIIIAEFNPRIISNVFALFYANNLQKKFIWWGHGMGPRTNNMNLHIRRWLAKRSDALIFYDSIQAEKFAEMGISRKRIFVAQNSIDTEEIEKLVEHNPRDRRNRILYIGRLIKRKKVDLLIRGFSAAQSYMGPEVKLTIIGEGPEYANLKCEAAHYSISDKIEFVGGIYQQSELAPFFNSAWVSISPGCVGLSAIHSLAYGVPMIVARNEPHGPETSALKDDVNTLFFSSNSVEELAKRLVFLESDPAYWQRLNLAARHGIYERFSLSSMAKVFEQAIQFVQSPKTSTR